MERYICMTCGTQYELSKEPPMECQICLDERQYVPEIGQKWTTLHSMRKQNHYKNVIHQAEKRLYSIHTKPSFAIGQTAYLVKGMGINVLWDCITYLDQPSINKVNQLGGIDAIAISHPHYYAAYVEWADTFDVPVYIHEADQKWIMRSGNGLILWSGESLQIKEDFTLHRLGGHFQGGTILHWVSGNEGKGVLLTGDIIQVVADRRWVSFMYSYPNLIPLPASTVKEIAEKVQDMKFDRIYNAFNGVVKERANESVQKSAQRYIKALEGKLFET